MSVGSNIRKIRKLRGISQEELAERIGLTRSQISNIESGRRSTSAKRMSQIAEVLKCRVSDFYDKTEELERDDEKWVIFGKRMEERGYTLEQLEEWIKVAEAFDKRRQKNSE